MANYRQGRIEVEIKKELDNIIRNLKDPRIKGVVSIVAVDVTKDLRYAKVYISVLGKDDERKNTIEALTAAAGFIRREIGGKVQLRYTPEFIFKLDDSIEYGARMNSLINDVIKKDENS